jgi:uncharacterized protein YqgV (UPF0045/DUF77 family)
MTIKQFFRALFFFIALSIAILMIMNIFTQNKTNSVMRTFNDFYKESDDSIDGVLIGSSIAHRAWIAPLIWHKTGMAIYPVATDGQAINMTVTLLKEVTKTQNIKFAVIDLNGIRSNSYNSARIRSVTDGMKFSANRINAVTAALKFAEDIAASTGKPMKIDTTDISFYIPFVMYHSRWLEGLTKADFVGDTPMMKAYHKDKPFHYKVFKKPNLVTEAGGLSEMGKKTINEIIEYGKKNKLELVFTYFPTLLSRSQQMQINEAAKMVQAAGYDCVDMHAPEVYEQLKMDPAIDYHDVKHMNIRGAIKVSTYMANYLDDKFDLKDKRNDANYKSWDDSYLEFDEFYKAAKAKVEQ